MGRVSINKCLGDPAEAIERGAELIGGVNVPPHSRVVIKPNICNSKNPYDMVLTDFRVIKHAIKMAQRFTDNVTIVESDNVSGSAEKRIVESGLMKMIEECNVTFRNLSKDSFEEHDVAGARIGIPRTVLEADYFMNLPKMKTCGHTLVTLSLKNLFGLLVDKDKKKFHKYLGQILPYLGKTIRHDLIIVDGITCMEGNGPVIGTPKCLNLVVVGTNPVEVDSVCTSIMGFDPNRVSHIANASKAGVGQIDLNKIDIVGEKLEETRTVLEKPYSIRATIRSMRSIPKIYT